MNRTEKIKNELKQYIDDLSIDDLATFLTISREIDSKIGLIGLGVFKEFETEIIKAKGNAGIDALDASGHYVDVFTKWLAEDPSYLKDF